MPERQTTTISRVSPANLATLLGTVPSGTSSLPATWPRSETNSCGSRTSSRRGLSGPSRSCLSSVAVMGGSGVLMADLLPRVGEARIGEQRFVGEGVQERDQVLLLLRVQGKALEEAAGERAV